jgi:DNA-binding LytR/AlgR family response regulator
MKIVIIEDEVPARERLAALLNEIDPATKIVAALDTVVNSAKWFSQNQTPDLVMLDVQLADGTAFDLLNIAKVDCPIIFTTAYSHHALEAFKAKSIDYLLKPVKKADLQLALGKLDQFRQLFKSPTSFADLRSSSQAAEYKKRFIIRFGEHIKSVSVENISYFISENKYTSVRTFDGHTYPMEHTLDTLEQMLDPRQFFRLNRQYVVNLSAISEMRAYSKARVLVKLDPPVKDPPIVSSDRAADFKLWLGGDL